MSSKREIIDFSLVTNVRWSGVHAFEARREMDASGFTGG